jgi:hypothetical protein
MAHAPPLTATSRGSISAYREDGQGEADHKHWRASAAVLSSEPSNGACFATQPSSTPLGRCTLTEWWVVKQLVIAVT